MIMIKNLYCTLQMLIIRKHRTSRKKQDSGRIFPWEGRVNKPSIPSTREVTPRGPSIHRTTSYRKVYVPTSEETLHQHIIHLGGTHAPGTHERQPDRTGLRRTNIRPSATSSIHALGYHFIDPDQVNCMIIILAPENPTQRARGPKAPRNSKRSIPPNQRTCWQTSM
ncbi:uncharacterized protein LOC129747178 [Uranotaenia lowii]|uniref:uncharacterized protein LOC129747178 n=1 Tax=Uranotaenia lowii TaxID=190385 RepID=UPI0024796B6F|nr:uncharacterized protein LOC129747178 [Uranotaenia lowii]